MNSKLRNTENETSFRRERSIIAQMYISENAGKPPGLLDRGMKGAPTSNRYA